MKKLYAACNRKWMPRAALLVLAGLFAWTAGVQAQTLQVSGLVTGAQGGGEVGVTIVPGNGYHHRFERILLDQGPFGGCYAHLLVSGLQNS